MILRIATQRYTTTRPLFVVAFSPQLPILCMCVYVCFLEPATVFSHWLRLSWVHMDLLSLCLLEDERGRGEEGKEREGKGKEHTVSTVGQHQEACVIVSICVNVCVCVSESGVKSTKPSCLQFAPHTSDTSNRISSCFAPSFLYILLHWGISSRILTYGSAGMPPWPLISLPGMSRRKWKRKVLHDHDQWLTLLFRPWSRQGGSLSSTSVGSDVRLVCRLLQKITTGCFQVKRKQDKYFEISLMICEAHSILNMIWKQRDGRLFIRPDTVS